jgi:hypothetical protein
MSSTKAVLPPFVPGYALFRRTVGMRYVRDGAGKPGAARRARCRYAPLLMACVPTSLN